MEEKSNSDQYKLLKVLGLSYLAGHTLELEDACIHSWSVMVFVQLYLIYKCNICKESCEILRHFNLEMYVVNAYFTKFEMHTIVQISNKYVGSRDQVRVFQFFPQV